MPEKIVYSEDVFTVQELLTPEECAAYIAQSEAQGYDDAPITTAFGPVHAPEIRNNQRVMLDAPEVAEALWRRVAEFAPPKWEGWNAVGLNERLRFYRYDAGQQFNWHYDGYFERANGERSQFTFMIYLNEDFEGGELEFKYLNHRIAPKQGLLVAFPSDWRYVHAALPVKSGVKHTVVSFAAAKDSPRVDKPPPNNLIRL
jgi:predicted 2-oxoglutarate/Fe(II)-dependent dioxygenase YbiX